MLREDLKTVQDYSLLTERTLIFNEYVISSIRSADKYKGLESSLFLKKFSDFSIYFLHVYNDLLVLTEGMFIWKDPIRRSFFARMTTVIVQDFFEKFNGSIEDLTFELRRFGLEEFELEYLQIRRNLNTICNNESKEAIAFVRNKAAAHKDKGENFSVFLMAMDTMDCVEIEKIAEKLKSQFLALTILNKKITDQIISNYKSSKPSKITLE